MGSLRLASYALFSYTLLMKYASPSFYLSSNFSSPCKSSLIKSCSPIYGWLMLGTELRFFLDERCTILYSLWPPLSTLLNFRPSFARTIFTLSAKLLDSCCGPKLWGVKVFTLLKFELFSIHTSEAWEMGVWSPMCWIMLSIGDWLNPVFLKNELFLGSRAWPDELSML